MHENGVTVAENGLTPEPPPERDLYPVNEAAVRLGGISERQVWRLIRDGRLKAKRLGGRTLIDPDAIAELKAELPDVKAATPGDAA